jgi:hypothetical protein
MPSFGMWCFVVLVRTTGRNFPEDSILPIQRRESLKSYKMLLFLIQTYTQDNESCPHFYQWLTEQSFFWNQITYDFHLKALSSYKF